MESRSSDFRMLEVPTWFYGHCSFQVVGAILVCYNHCSSDMKVWLQVFTLTFFNLEWKNMKIENLRQSTSSGLWPDKAHTAHTEAHLLLVWANSDRRKKALHTKLTINLCQIGLKFTYSSKRDQYIERKHLGRTTPDYSHVSCFLTGNLRKHLDVLPECVLSKDLWAQCRKWNVLLLCQGA